MKKPILMAEKPAQLKELRTVSKPVDFSKDDITDLISNMFDTMKGSKGVGLSAIQIGVPLRVVVAEYKDDTNPVPKSVLVNPKITWASKNEVEDEEGCLSFPEVYGMVSRPEKVKYTAFNEKGEKIEGKATGLFARVIQHEIDHLNGVLFIDRVTDDLYTYEAEPINPTDKI